MRMERPLDERLRINALYDIYGSLLTEKQRECLELYFEEDLSLTEIAETLGISRQGVHHQINRAILALEHFEAHLWMEERSRHWQKIIETFGKYLSSLPDDSHLLIEGQEIYRLMQKEMGDEDGI